MHNLKKNVRNPNFMVDFRITYPLGICANTSGLGNPSYSEEGSRLRNPSYSEEESGLGNPSYSEEGSGLGNPSYSKTE